MIPLANLLFTKLIVLLVARMFRVKLLLTHLNTWGYSWQRGGTIVEYAHLGGAGILIEQSTRWLRSIKARLRHWQALTVLSLNHSLRGNPWQYLTLCSNRVYTGVLPKRLVHKLSLHWYFTFDFSHLLLKEFIRVRLSLIFLFVVIR